ncbi:TPA: hypothetical protein I6715_003404 [Vibrio cholerae]|uniref:Uncharacterized protein n=1 Tax=Vibrio cholerae TaxID=666 RepID=A0ABD7SRQ0_VIBCL|nr:hypothetical protein [Vibrio cholerae]HAT7601933.1 hypothetical protein [Vibrio cholerae O1]EKF9578273.1 hypothetical protein [Vibrio cholerae]ELP1740297.1 hypothetical protein [Vibrio cholerae]EMA7652502.1 hypothetical protein [Vibrio cholerae]MBS3661098.1 hypothetical protein [Vibrio cholerae]
MPRTIQYIGEETEISDYLPEHYPENQTCKVVQGIFINPHLRKDFDYTPNEEREPLENEHWYGRAYIVTDEFIDEKYADFIARMTKRDPQYKPEPEAIFEERQRRCKESWLEAYPSGVRYEVRCLTGGAWDRSSSQGMFASLGQAIEKIESGIITYGYI